MWSSENDIFLSAATYYIDTKINGKTISLLNPIKVYGDPPKFQLAEGDSYYSNCGKIFITLNHLLVFQCTFCNHKYGTLLNFFQHISATHLGVKKTEISEIIKTKELDTKKSPLTKLEPVQEYLLSEVNSEPIIKKRVSKKKTSKQNSKKGSIKLGKTEENENEIDYDTMETEMFIEELEPVHNYLSLEATRETIVDNTHSLNKRPKKKLTIKKVTTKQEDKKEAEPAKFKKSTKNESCDLKSEEQQNKLSISSLEDREATTALKNTHKPLAYTCDQCDEVFGKKISLSTHISIHSNAKNHKCTICESTFTLKSNLTKHLLRHTNVKNFSCEICDKRFFSSTEVAVHKRIHTGERPYVCFKCGNGFKTTSSLSRHMKRHNNIRTKKCDICEKTFLDSFGLRNHMAGHSNERPFVCSYCSISFSRKRTLKQHIKLHINAREYKCNICDKSFNQKPALLSHMNHNHKLLES